MRRLRMWGSAGVAVAGDDDVIKEPEADGAGGFDQGRCGAAVGEAGGGVAGWVVVCDGERAAVVPEHRIEHFAYRHR